MSTQVKPLPGDSSRVMSLTEEEKRLTRNWILYGIIAGILGDFAYAAAIAPIPIPDAVKMYLGMAFGPLLSVAFVGLYTSSNCIEKRLCFNPPPFSGLLVAPSLI